MKAKGGIAVLLTVVLSIAVCLQVIRSDYMLRFYTNAAVREPQKQTASLAASSRPASFLVLYEAGSSDSVGLKDNVVQTLEYMHENVAEADAASPRALPDSSCSGVITTFEDLGKYTRWDSLLAYVKNGGRLLLAMRPLDSDALAGLQGALGISKYRTLRDTKGLTLKTNTLIQCEGLHITPDVASSNSLDVQLAPSAALMAVSDEKIPLMWKIALQKGVVMVYNGTNLSEKSSRGLLVGMISQMFPSFLYPIINAKVGFIDDFPAPVPEGYNEELYREFGVTTNYFYKYIWLPDMMQSAKDYNLKYTGVLIEDYNKNTTPPFSTAAKNRDFILFANEVLHRGGEIGLHGYNHQSLAPEGFVTEDLGYTPWKTQSAMRLSLETAIRYAASMLPNYRLQVYVPPSNILSPQGRQAVVAGMKDLKVIAGVYTAGAGESDAYVQEYEVRDGVCEFPRVTSGYIDDAYTYWSIYNAVTSVGVFSHFVHPDDVLDSQRNMGKNWEQLYKGYNDILSAVQGRYGWLRPLTASEAAEEEKHFLELEPTITYGKDEITVSCRNFYQGDSFLLRSGSASAGTNCKVRQIDGGVYLVTPSSAQFTIRVGG